MPGTGFHRPPDRADARQARRRAARRRRLPVRAQMGRLPRHRLSRRRRRVHPEPRPAAARSLLSRAARRACSSGCRDGCVVDGEIVIATPHGLDFDALQLRLHPAASRVAKLAKETPASFVAFDLLAVGRRRPARRAAADAPRAARRAARGARAADPPDADDARSRRSRRSGWRASKGAGLDGVIAKPAAAVYQPGKRAMIKVKHVAHRRLRGRRLPLAQDAARARWSARCCSGSTTTTDGCTTSASPRRSRWRRGKQLASELAPLRENALDEHPWRDWAERGAVRRRACRAGRAAGARARICRGSRCASSASAR